jgi:acetyltransferase-like isoleucine patch superfamily enzyme
MPIPVRKWIARFVSILKARRQGFLLGGNSYVHPSVTCNGNVQIGDNCIIRRGVIIDAQKGGVIRVGDNSSINPYAVLYGAGGITVGSDTRIATHVVIVSSEHVFADAKRPIRKQGWSAKGVSIGKDVWIGAHATILDGSCIGDGCVVGAGTIVKGILDPYGVYVGNPARKIRERA